MARWIYQNPPETAPESEQKTAEHLAHLGDEFAVRWGFYYNPGKSGVFREGDFAIQGPGGHILVMEAKGGPLTCNPTTGVWSLPGGKNPFIQLDREVKGVVERIHARAEAFQIQPPFVDEALAAPDLELAQECAYHAGVPRERFVVAGDLRAFARWWMRRFGNRPVKCSAEDARRVFDAVFAIGVPANATRHTLDFADRIIEQQTECGYELLDALSENQQLLFSGGPGTGKTWLAIEQARRHVSEGAKVLFLCYNIQFEFWLREVCRKISREIHVFGYQSLGELLLGRPHPTFGGNREAETRYFEETLPAALWEKVNEPGFQASFDVLVVDEAQDHNTAPSLVPEEGPGWWSVYFRLLRRGVEAPVSIFYDREQRFVRRGGDFESEEIRRALAHPVRVVLRTPVRFTRQLRRYFRSLICRHTEGMLRDMSDSRVILPQGPEPQLVGGVGESEEGQVCARILREWIDGNGVRPQEILLLHAASRAPEWLSAENEEGVRFYSGHPSAQPADAILAVSINRAKGLDRRAVVVTGVLGWESASLDEYQAKTFVQGVTRARQLLAVLTRPKPALPLLGDGTASGPPA
jgi:hypothetical protein